MKKKDSKARTQVIFGTLLFVLIFMSGLYIMVNFPRMYVILVALAVVDLGCLYAVINGCLAMQNTGNPQLEEICESLFRSEKASYLLMKKSFEELGEKLEHLDVTPEFPSEEIISAQKAAARVVINRGRDNTENLMKAYEQVIAEIEEIKTLFGEYQNEVMSLKQQDTGESVDNKALEIRLQDLTVDLKDMEIRLSNAIMQSQKMVTQAPVMAAPVQQVMPVQMSTAESVPVMEATEPVSEPVSEPEEVAVTEEVPVAEVLETAKMMEEPSEEIIEEPAEEPEEISAVVEEAETGEPEELIEEPELEPVEEEKLPMPDLSDPNKSLDAAEIDALFANMDISLPEKEETPEPEVVAEPEPEEEADSIPEITEQQEEEKAPVPDLSDPNKALDADEIAALFANMGGDSAPAPESEPVEEEKPPMPDLSDPNKALSADEIAALFANMGA